MDALLASLTSRQVTEWMAYAELEPFGPLREDYRAGMLAAAIFNNAFGRKKGSRIFKPEDFYATLAGPTKQQASQSMAEDLKVFTRAMGGQIRKRGEPIQSGRRKPEKAAQPKSQGPGQGRGKKHRGK